MTPRITLLLVIFVAACSDDPPAEPLSVEESAVVMQAVEDTVETLSQVNTTDFAVTALTYRLIPCATVETDRLTFLTATFACSQPFQIEGRIHLEKSTPEQLISITDLMIKDVSIDSATTLVVPKSPTQPRSFDGALIVEGPRRELTSVVTANWVVSGRCMILNAAGFVLLNSVEHSFTITDKRVCRKFF